MWLAHRWRAWRTRVARGRWLPHSYGVAFGWRTAPASGGVPSGFARAGIPLTHRPSRGSALALEGRGDLPALLDRALGRLDLLDLLEADEAQQCRDEDVDDEDDEEGPLEVEAVTVPVEEVGERHRQHDDREHREEGRAGEQADPDAAVLDADLQLGLGELDLLGDEPGDVALRVHDELAERRIGVLDRFGGHAEMSFVVRRELGAATLPTRMSRLGPQVSREVWSARGHARGEQDSTTPKGEPTDGITIRHPARTATRRRPMGERTRLHRQRQAARPAGRAPRAGVPPRGGRRLPAAPAGGCRGPRLGPQPVGGVVRRAVARTPDDRRGSAAPRRIAAALGQRRLDGDLLLRGRPRDQVRAGQRRPARPEDRSPADRRRDRRDGRAGPALHPPPPP